MSSPSHAASDRFKTVVAVMIAAVMVLSALTAWRASIAAGEAEQANSAGLAATLNLQEAQAVNSILLYQHYRAYTDYERYKLLGDLLGRDADAASETERDTLVRQQQEAYTLAEELSDTFFSARYLKPDGGYDTSRELGEQLADASTSKDLNPHPHFDEADRTRSKSRALIGVLIIFVIAIWFLTLAEALDHFLKYSLAGVGGLFASIGVLGVLVIEVGGPLLSLEVRLP